MATKRILPLNKIESVTAGGTATITLPTNVRYHQIVLQYDTDTTGGPTEAIMETEVTEVRCIIDEVAQRTASAAQIFDINRSKDKSPQVGDASNPGFIPLFFSEPQRESKAEREATAWGMQGVGTFTIEVDIANNSSQTPTLKGYAIVDDVQEPPLGIVKWKKNTLSVSGTGETVFGLNTEKGDSYQGLFLFEGSAGDIDNLLLEWDGVKIAQYTESQEDALFSNSLDGFAQVSGLVHLPLDHNHPADALRTVKMVNGKAVKVEELLLTLNMGAANNVVQISETVGIPD